MKAPQAFRIIFFFAYISLLAVVNYRAFGSLVPLEDWFWAGAFALVLSELIAQPYFTSPKDAVSNTVAVLAIALPLIYGRSLTIPNEAVGYWHLFTILSLVVLVGATFAMMNGESSNERLRNIAATLTRVVGIAGSPKTLFTLLFLLLIWSSNYNREQILWLSSAWIIIVVGRPLENGFHLINRLRLAWVSKPAPKQLGILHSRKQPNRVTIKNYEGKQTDYGTNILVNLDKDNVQLGMITDNYELAGEYWSSALIYASKIAKESLGPNRRWGAMEAVYLCSQDELVDVPEDVLSSEVYKNRKNFIGVVVEKSDINKICLELMRDDLSIEEGQLVSTKVNEKSVLYQIINGITQSEILEQKNLHGYVEIQARKIGVWTGNIFEPVSWVPDMYSPVYLAQAVGTKFSKDYIGFVPRTDYGITVNCSALVTHNTAILGVLGVGKTSLALELIVRMLSEGIKVWVIDITEQYEKELLNFISTTKQNEADKKICSAIKASRDTTSADKGSGGNHKIFSKEIASHIKNFLDDDHWMLRIVNPSTFDVTEQTSYRDKQGDAGIAQLTVAQITRIIAEELLEALKGKDKLTDKARLCLVLEEAHSLVPEWNAVAHEGDKNATNGTVKAVLQGRKYGFGCLLITQRTAHVTKSILNQCNTIFGLRAFDATGMDFLENYIGKDYASLLATLPNRQSVVFGKGVNAQSPLLIRLNDRPEFLKNYPMPIIPADEEEVDESNDGTAYDESAPPPDDVGDIPF